MNVTESLINWYSQNKRPLPWRETRDPYRIWLSEVILQQTRVAQGTDYYHRFLIAFPDVQSLALAAEQDVLKLWQGLGYYSRARNMHFTAKEVIERFNGIFPQSAAGLKKLKGIGDYTAAAISSICYNEPVAVVDGNVARVISRLYAIEIPIDTNKGKKTITELSNTLLDINHPGTFNQAAMELGALVCTPKNPACNNCPLAASCEANKHKISDKFPVKSPKKSPVARYMNYLVIRFLQNKEEFLLLRKRTGNDIWKNMYDFPCIETGQDLDITEVLNQCQKSGLLGGCSFVVENVSDDLIHILSHRRLYAKFIRMELNGLPNLQGDVLAVRKNEIADLPIPRLIDRYLATIF